MTSQKFSSLRQENSHEKRARLHYSWIEQAPTDEQISRLNKIFDEFEKEQSKEKQDRKIAKLPEV